MRYRIMSFKRYIKLMLTVVISSTFVLALFVGIPILFTGDDPAEARLSLEFDAVDGIAIIVALPLIAALVFTILSPLSFYVYKFTHRGTKGETDED